LKADIYKDTAKTQAIEKLILNNLASMEKSNTLQGEDEEQDPTVHLWLMYFASQHLYFKRNFERAFAYVEQAIEHTPTVVDLYVLKAKIYKSAGDKHRACALYEEARKLDLADRYLNALSSRYKIRID
jgi:peptide alpha-N-acetyltransferase